MLDANTADPSATAMATARAAVVTSAERPERPRANAKRTPVASAGCRPRVSVSVVPEGLSSMAGRAASEPTATQASSARARTAAPPSSTTGSKEISPAAGSSRRRKPCGTRGVSRTAPTTPSSTPAAMTADAQTIPSVAACRRVYPRASNGRRAVAPAARWRRSSCPTAATTARPATAARITAPTAWARMAFRAEELTMRPGWKKSCSWPGIASSEVRNPSSVVPGVRRTAIRRGHDAHRLLEDAPR